MRKFVVFIFMTFILFLGACESTKEVKVIFEVNGGDELQAITLKNDDDPTLPFTTKVGYIFLGWYFDSELTKEVNMKDLFKQKEIVLYAKWKTEVYNISFVNIIEEIKDIKLVYNSNIPNLPNPYKADDVFMGWYLDDNFIEPFNLEKMPNRDLILYAKWNSSDVSDNVVINFETFGGEELEQIITNYYMGLTLPFPDKKGSIFLGWYLDSDYENYLDFDYIFTQEEVTLYAKWKYVIFQITFENVNDKLPLIHFEYDEILELPIPYKPEDTFVGWYLDSEFKEEFILTKMPDYNLVLYAKWFSDDYEEDIPVDDPLTEIIFVYDIYDGNTNGNINNLGIATYCMDDKLHYYSLNSSIYSYDPSLNETKLIYTLEHGGKPLYLNILAGNLYFINSNNNHLLKYKLADEALVVLSEGDHEYLKVIYERIYTTVNRVINDENRVVMQIYKRTNDEFSREGNTYLKNINIQNNFTYYFDFKSYDPSLSIKSYNGMGKYNLFYLENYNIATVYEIVLYNYDYFTGDDYFALSLDVKGIKGLYLYNTGNSEELEKVMDGDIKYINYSEHYLYFILDDNIYRYNIKAKSVTDYYEIGSNKKNLTIINHWFYYNDENNNLYRINPLTKKIEQLT